MGTFLSSIVRLLIRKPLLFVLLFLGSIGFLVNGIFQLNINEDLYSIFPKGEEYQKVSQLIQENSINKQIVFSIKSSDNQTLLDENLAAIEEEITTKFKNEITDVKVYSSVNEKKLLRYFQKSAILRFNEQDYENIDQQLATDSINLKIKSTAQKLKGTNGFFLKHLYALDPIGLTFKKLESLKPEQGKGSYVVKDGLIYTKDEQKIIFFATVAVDSKDIVQLTKLNEKLTSFKENINQKKHLEFDYFGTFQIAVENAKQVKADTYLTSFLSLAAILLLLVLYYRSVLAPFYFVLPAVFGVLCGMGMMGYLQPSISAISLATASVLLGIVLDYSFHFFTHYKHSGDLIKTIEEISAPMVVGSFTTVAALGALLFAESIILQNFGLIALFTLLGSVLFTLVFQPVLFTLTKVKLPQSIQKTTDKKTPKILLRIGFVVIILITFISFQSGLQLSFDADLNNLSYHTDEIKEKENFYTGINPGEEKKFYVIASSNTAEEAKAINNQIYDTLQNLKGTLAITELISTAPYLPTQEQITRAENKWNGFWSSRKNRVEQEIKTAASAYHFSENAFNPFYKWIDSAQLNPEDGAELLEDLSLDKFAYQSDGKQTYITSIVINRSDLKACKEHLRNIDNIYILDIAEVTEMMLNSVQKDFNFLLIFSALLVFVTLLLLYGRIELALFAFLPMVIGWVWILGITNFFDIKFNFVNIVITTFIFGLGDDFSIFSTDGLIQQYRTGSSAYKSYRSAILLSGITTILGTGVLIFAKHPAIHSIALISTVGISTILFIALFIQPSIFNLFVFKRLKKGRSVITFFTLIYSVLLFTYFFVGSILLNVFLLLILYPLPVKKQRKRDFLNYLVSKLAKSTLYAGLHVKKGVYIENVDFSKPKLLIANHSSFLDILSVIMLHPKTVIMVKSWVYNSPVFGLFIRYAGYPFAKEGASQDLSQLKELIANGYSIVIFPEGTRSKDGEMNRFHKGAFHIAHELELDIQPLLLIGIHLVNPKNDILINRGHLIVKALDVIPFDSAINYQETAKIAKKNMQDGMAIWKKELAKIDFWKPFIIKNYILKGPILEWYVRVKWMLEKKNFDYYDTLIDDRKVIYDFGCGYGYLSYYLHYRNKNRKIIGVDYDADKIAVANNGVKYSEHLQFEANDIRQTELSACDVIFLNDVLHYLPKEDQYHFLQKALDVLDQQGILFIRDGMKKEEDTSYKYTKITEFLSTKVFGFNKSEHPLEFISEVEMRNFAESNNLSLEIIKHSKTTSNVLLILRKS